MQQHARTLEKGPWGGTSAPAAFSQGMQGGKSALLIASQPNISSEIDDSSDGKLQLQNKQHAIRTEGMWRNSHKNFVKEHD